MTTETDEQFVTRMADELAVSEGSDLARLFALARRGAVVREPCHETCEPSRYQHHINCPNRFRTQEASDE